VTWFLQLAPQQEPFDLGPDDQGRAQWACNFLAWKRSSASFLLEVVAVLEAANVGRREVSIFGTSQAVLPPASVQTPWLHLKVTGGVAPAGTLADPTAYRRPGLQVIATAGSSPAAEALCQAAYAALAAVVNRQVTA
jgi:hypothetical protein